MDFEPHKKAFDPTVCFTFFGSWLKTMEALETEQDRASPLYRLFKAIAHYAMYEEEPNFADSAILTAVWSMMEETIDSSKKRRRSGFARDELEAKHREIVQAIINHPTMSCRQIGEMVGAGKSAVDRAKKKYADEISKALTDAPAAVLTPCHRSVDSCPISSVAYNGMGQGQDGTAGQGCLVGRVQVNTSTGIEECYYGEGVDDGELPF